ncbi:class I adenylate-forming enzyme family protein [Sphaerisporangium sp. NPDC049003]|uniref:class I adenylate-forming enzyme family protein n=1 Tax=Sphaerisporangium sp. NPDC049003 TaxID=3364517 RepID=UPI0037197BCF
MTLALGRWLRDRARATPHRTAIVFEGDDTSYGELDARSERLAAGLLAAGVRPGDRVATLTGNRPEHVELFFACAKAGLVLTPVNVRLTAPEVAYQLTDAEPSILLAAPELVPLAEEARMRSGHPCRIAELTRDGLDALASTASEATAPHTPGEHNGTGDDGGPGTGHSVPNDPNDPNDPADDAGLLLVYTGGTTGRPKGALLTHANCFWTNLSLDRGCELREDDVVLQVLPQFHVGGWNVQPLLAWWKGATVVLEPSFDAGRTLRLIAERGVTTMMGVPATYLFMAQDPGFATADLSRLRRVVVGGAPMPEPLLRTWLDRGVRIVQGYGLTEAAPNVLCLPEEDIEGRVGWAGIPYPHVDVALRDVETGGTLDGAGIGELVVRGPNVFPGYWRDPEATRAAVTGGWLRTGDIAERDADGFYRIRGRAKDMYVSGGENVYPAEAESVLQGHAEVAEVAVVGVPDERWGEVGCAFVVPVPGAAPEASDLIAYCRVLLAGFKVPKYVRLVDRLPRSAVDKVLKSKLRGVWEQAG